MSECVVYYEWAVDVQQDRYQCTGCDAAFSNSVDRDRHTAKKHTIPKPQCEMCNKEFANEKALEKHLDIKHLDRADKYTSECPTCHVQVQKLKAHIQQKHENKQKLNVYGGVCPHCNKSFVNDYKVKRHILQVHDNVRPFTCVQCEKSFLDKKDLRRHILGVHFGEKVNKWGKGSTSSAVTTQIVKKQFEITDRLDGSKKAYLTDDRCAGTFGSTGIYFSADSLGPTVQTKPPADLLVAEQDHELLLAEQETSQLVVEHDTNQLVVEHNTNHLVVEHDTRHLVVKQKTSKLVVDPETNHLAIDHETNHHHLVMVEQEPLIVEQETVLTLDNVGVEEGYQVIHEEEVINLAKGDEPNCVEEGGVEVVVPTQITTQVSEWSPIIAVIQGRGGEPLLVQGEEGEHLLVQGEEGGQLLVHEEEDQQLETVIVETQTDAYDPGANLFAKNKELTATVELPPADPSPPPFDTSPPATDPSLPPSDPFSPPTDPSLSSDTSPSIHYKEEDCPNNQSSVVTLTYASHNETSNNRIHKKECHPKGISTSDGTKSTNKRVILSKNCDSSINTRDTCRNNSSFSTNNSGTLRNTSLLSAYSTDGKLHTMVYQGDQDVDGDVGSVGGGGGSVRGCAGGSVGVGAGQPLYLQPREKEPCYLQPREALKSRRDESLPAIQGGELRRQEPTIKSVDLHHEENLEDDEDNNLSEKEEEGALVEREESVDCREGEECIVIRMDDEEVIEKEGAETGDSAAVRRLVVLKEDRYSLKRSRLDSTGDLVLELIEKDQVQDRRLTQIQADSNYVTVRWGEEVVSRPQLTAALADFSFPTVDGRLPEILFSETTEEEQNKNKDGPDNDDQEPSTVGGPLTIDYSKPFSADKPEYTADKPTSRKKVRRKIVDPKDIDEDTIECPDDGCDKRFKGKSKILQYYRHYERVHLQIKHHVCKFCLFKFYSKHDLVRHCESVHSKIKTVCPIVGCNKLVVRVDQHIKHTHNQTPKTDPTKSKCDECGATFNRIYDMQRHKDTVHLGWKKFKCVECGRGFTDKRDMLRHHGAVHLKIKQSKVYHCINCGHKFRLKKDLAEHIASLECRNSLVHANVA